MICNIYYIIFDKDKTDVYQTYTPKIGLISLILSDI
jgi:hypothetical protein